ncbi:MAG TPA: sugar transferase [Bryobacteraceae bacterium]|nr:sugar transferase [Bryobacteraceae bacterium]
MFSRHNRKARFLFALSDVVLTALAFEAAYQTRAQLPLFEREFFIIVPTKALLLGCSVLTWVLLGHWLEIYDRLDSAHPRVILRDSFRQCTLGFIVIVLLEFLLRLDLSRFFLVLFFAYSFVLLTLFRWKAGSVVGVIRREFGAPHYVMVVGTGERALNLGRLLEHSEPYGVRLSAFIADAAGAPGSITLRNTYQVEPLAHLPLLLRKDVIDEIIFAVDSSRLAELEDAFLLCDEEGVRTRVTVDFFPHVNSDIYLDRLGGAPLLTFSAAPHDEILLLIKRAVDIALAAAGLVILAPLMVLVAVLIRITSPGPVIFRQIRCGLNGRRFVVYKFRSMCSNAEELKPALAHMSIKETAFKLPEDPRLTPVGRWLRKFSIDEWPQLWNVIRGDMSLVGPRPAVPEEVDNYKQWQRRRLRMRPGLTCLWALAGRDHLDFETWMKLDMQYIDNWSLALDWKIILRTIPQVLSGRGAH